MTAAVILAAISILLSATAQVLLKLGMSRLANSAVPQAAGFGHLIVSALSSPIIWLGLCTYGASAIVWLAVLARLELSLAYPFVAVGLVLTVFFGAFMFNEPLSYLKLGGVSLIVFGVVLVGLSARAG